MSLEFHDKAAQALLSLGVIILSGRFLGLDRTSSARTVTEHPYVAPEDIKSETCLACHPDKLEGKFIHKAVANGCESCHQTMSEKERESTTIKLLAVGGGLCATCHAAKEEAVTHWPYKNGQCTLCHEPHTSNFPGQARAEALTLCMSCHGASRPDVRISAEAKTVSVLGGRSLDLATYERAPKIGSDHPKRAAAGIPGHSGPRKDPPKPEGQQDCISCHEPHTSRAAHLLKSAARSKPAAGDPRLEGHAGIRTQFIGGTQ
jgi:predicted CXXCH cytochrome family protein